MMGMIELSSEPTPSSESSPQRWDLWPVVRRRWQTLAVCAAVGGCLTLVLWAMSTPVFESQGQLLVIKHEVMLRHSVRPMQEIVAVNPNELATQSEVARSVEVVTAALKQHGLEKLPSLQSAVTASLPIEQAVRDRLQVLPGARVAQVLELRYRSSSPEDSRAVLSAVMSEYARFVEEAGAPERQTVADLAPQFEQARSGESNTIGWLSVRPITPATVARNMTPSWKMYLALGLFGGLACGFGLACVQQVLDKSFETPAEVEACTGLPVLAQLPNLAVSPDVVSQTPIAPGTDTLRRLRNHLNTSTAGEPFVLALASVSPGGGTSTLAVNLACSLGRTGKNVLLVDCNLRQPALQMLPGVDIQPGLVAALARDNDPSQYIQRVSNLGISLLVAGEGTDTETDLFESAGFAGFLQSAGKQYDVVLLDCPAVLGASDAAVIGSQADRLLLNLRVSQDTKPQVHQAQLLLARSSVEMAGVVLNCWDSRMPSIENLFSYEQASNPGGRVPMQPPRISPPAPKGTKFRSMVNS